MEPGSVAGSSVGEFLRVLTAFSLEPAWAEEVYRSPAKRRRMLEEKGLEPDERILNLLQNEEMWFAMERLAWGLGVIGDTSDEPEGPAGTVFIN